MQSLLILNLRIFYSNKKEFGISLDHGPVGFCSFSVQLCYVCRPWIPELPVVAVKGIRVNELRVAFSYWARIKFHPSQCILRHINRWYCIGKSCAFYQTGYLVLGVRERETSTMVIYDLSNMQTKLSISIEHHVWVTARGDVMVSKWHRYI